MIRTVRQATLLRVAAMAFFGLTLSACNPGATRPAVALSASSYSVGQNAGSVSLTVARTGAAADAISVSYATADDTAVAGTDYTATSGTLQWAANDAVPKTIAVPVSTARSFSGSKAFKLALTDPSASTTIGNPGSATITISGGASSAAGSLQLADTAYTVAQSAGSLTVTVNRMGGSSGAVSVAYSTANGTATAGTDYTATTGTLHWADGDASSKTFSVAISNATPYSGSKTFAVELSDAIGTNLGTPISATVTISGDASPAVGSLDLSASCYAVAQSAGSLTVAVNRTGGSSGAISVAYATANGTAVAGTDYTATSGTLQWADGDASPKNFSVAISGATPLSGSKTFTVALSSPSAGATISSPGSAAATISGGAYPAAGCLQLSASSYAVAQSAGSVTVTVKRSNGSSGAVSVAYATADGTAVGGVDYTPTNGTLQWAAGDTSAKTFAVAISNAAPFSGSKAFSIALSSPAGGVTLSSPDSAGVTITGSKAGATAWVYYNGAMNWGGDWSFAATANYKDTAGVPIEGPYDIVITGQQWGGWQPYVSGNCQSNISACFDTTPYKYLIFSVKPTVANQGLASGFMSAGDTPDGVVIYDLSSYCSGGGNPPVGQWESCKVPLSAYGLTDKTILKFMISDQTGLASNRWYIDNVGFTAN